MDHLINLVKTTTTPAANTIGLKLFLSSYLMAGTYNQEDGIEKTF